MGFPDRQGRSAPGGRTSALRHRWDWAICSPNPISVQVRIGSALPELNVSCANEIICGGRGTKDLSIEVPRPAGWCGSTCTGVRLRCSSTARYTRFPFEARVEFFSFDEAYLKRLRERDFPTEQHFVAYFRKLLVIKLRSRLRGSQAVEDIAQETFLRVFKAMSSERGIRQPERLGAFVNSVCNNVLQEFYRSSGHGTQLDLDENTAEPVDHVLDLDGFLVSKETREQVRKVLDQLPEKDRQLLRAIFLEEKEKDQVCKEFGVDRDYLRVLLHRAKNNFRVFYGKSGTESARAPKQ